MKAKNFLVTISTVAVLVACKKDNPKEPDLVDLPSPAAESYASLSDFYKKNGVQMQTFRFDAAVGGSFVTPQNTTISIPGNAFNQVSGEVTLEFKDIYKKSDMLLSNMTTDMANGKPLKSGGEFYIKASQNGSALTIAPGNKIFILQPIDGAVDEDMRAFVAVNQNADSNQIAWAGAKSDSVKPLLQMYVYSLYQFASPASNGSWCNSDNSQYFAAYTQTALNINLNQKGYGADIFLCFKDVNSMVHVYPANTTGDDFMYAYAPVGLSATVVTIAEKEGKIYASFTPITIGTNQTINVDLKETTTEDFKAKLKALD